MSLRCLTMTEAHRAEPSPKHLAPPGGRISAAVSALAAWTPGIRTCSQWRAWAKDGHAGDAAAPLPQPQGVDAMLRRRLTPLARAALATLEDVLPAGSSARLVFASRHGELQRTLELLDAIARDEALSPTTFSLSVHNALAGVWSIARQDRSPSMALAAGAQTFPWSLVEAMAEVAAAPEQEVVLLYADDVLPGPYQAFADRPAPPLVLALRLAAQGPLSLETSWAEATAEEGESAAWAFLRGWFGEGGSASWAAPRRQWTWSKHAAA